MSTKRGGVQSSNVVLHIIGAMGKTFCGRRVDTVNCFAAVTVEAAVQQEQCCRLCARANRRNGRGFIPSERKS